MSPLPARRGRRRGEDPDFGPTSIATFVEMASKRHRAAGSSKPIEEAWHDLYTVSVDSKKQQEPGHYQRWLTTMKRKRSTVRKIVSTELQVARDSAKHLSGRLSRNKK